MKLSRDDSIHLTGSSVLGIANNNNNI